MNKRKVLRKRDYLLTRKEVETSLNVLHHNTAAAQCIIRSTNHKIYMAPKFNDGTKKFRGTTFNIPAVCTFYSHL